MSVSYYTVSAICGNFFGESGVNPERREIGTNITDLLDVNQYGGYGLGQWTNKISIGLTRRTQLIEWLDANGWNRGSGTGQINYLLYENYWHQNYGSYSSLTEFLENTSTDRHELCRIYWRCWEGITPSEASQNQRINFCDEAFTYMINHYDDESITTWVANNGTITRQDALNNSVLICRQLMGEEPPTPPDPPSPPEPITHRKMPLWMYLRKI